MKTISAADRNWPTAIVSDKGDCNEYVNRDLPMVKTSRNPETNLRYPPKRVAARARPTTHVNVVWSDLERGDAPADGDEDTDNDRHNGNH